MLQFHSYDTADTLSVTWLMTLQESDTIQLKADDSRPGTVVIHCWGYNGNCVFNGNSLTFWGLKDMFFHLETIGAS